jgi:hypothetical protein
MPRVKAHPYFAGLNHQPDFAGLNHQPDPERRLFPER